MQIVLSYDNFIDSVGRRRQKIQLANATQAVKITATEEEIENDAKIINDFLSFSRKIETASHCFTSIADSFEILKTTNN